MREAPFQRGDWLRFYQGGRLVIGQVEYVTREHGHWQARTDHGTVREDSVQEKRPPNRGGAP